MHRRLSRAFAGLFLSAALAMPGGPAAADHTPRPTAVTVAGSFQSELGCSGDWQPDCAVTHLAYDQSDDVWQGSWTIPAGSFEYKAALNNSWDENYGLNATADGANVPLALGSASTVKFYYDHKSHWITDNRRSAIVTAAGSFQLELGCPGDWDPSCLRSWLQDPGGRGAYAFATTAIPAGSYEAKAAISESWDENYGAGGAPNGANIAFTVPANGSLTTFRYDPATHLLSITSATPNRAPTANPDAYAVDQGGRLAVVAPGVLANDTDPDGDTLTAALVTAPSHGTVSLGAGGGFTYTPGALFAGTDSFAYRANDGSADSAPAPVAIVVKSTSALIQEQTKLTDGQKSSLTSKLDDASSFVAQGKLGPACGKLDEFVTQVLALVPTKLDPVTADTLVRAARARKALYGCP
jgi:hypothetical protein